MLSTVTHGAMMGVHEYTPATCISPNAKGREWVDSCRLAFSNISGWCSSEFDPKETYKISALTAEKHCRRTLVVGGRISSHGVFVQISNSKTHRIIGHA